MAADFFDVASPADAEKVFGAGFGSLGPVGLPENIKIIADRKVQDVKNAVVGANEDGFHYTGANAGRDFQVTEYVDIREVKEGEPSPDGHGFSTLPVVSRLVTSSNSVHAIQTA